MIKEFREDMKSDFCGTIIDIETIGEFDDRYKDSRRYRKLKPVIFGYINRRGLQIFCGVGEASIGKLSEKISEVIDGLERPFYAFNCNFEEGVLFHNLRREIPFHGELQQGHEPKGSAVKCLGISNYDDPFNDIGLRCMRAWQDEHFDDAMKHNRACLLKERDILSKRGFSEPKELQFVE